MPWSIGSSLFYEKVQKYCSMFTYTHSLTKPQQRTTQLYRRWPAVFCGAKLERGWALHPRPAFRLNSGRWELKLKRSVTHCRCPRWTWGESRTPFCGRGAPPACTPAGSSVGGCSSRRSGAGSGLLLPATKQTMFRDPERANVLRRDSRLLLCATGHHLRTGW